MCNKDDFVGCLHFLLILLGWFIFVIWIFALIEGIETRNGPCVSEYWNGEDTLYVDSNRFCHFEKEMEGYFTTRNPNPTRKDTCIICLKTWSKHPQIQRTQEEIKEAFTETQPLL